MRRQFADLLSPADKTGPVLLLYGLYERPPSVAMISSTVSEAQNPFRTGLTSPAIGEEL